MSRALVWKKNKYRAFGEKAGLLILAAFAVCCFSRAAAFAAEPSIDSSESQEEFPEDIMEDSEFDLDSSESDEEHDDTEDRDTAGSEAAAPTYHRKETETAPLEFYIVEEGSDAFTSVTAEKDGKEYPLSYVSLIDAWISPAEDGISSFENTRLTFRAADGKESGITCKEDVFEIGYMSDGNLTKLLADPLDTREIRMPRADGITVELNFDEEEYLASPYLKAVDMECFDADSGKSALQKDVYLSYDGRYRLSGNLDGCISAAIVGTNSEEVGLALELCSVHLTSKLVPAIHVTNTDNSSSRTGLVFFLEDDSSSSITGQIRADSIVSIYGDTGTLTVSAEDIALNAGNDINMEGGICLLEGKDAAIKSRRAFFLDGGSLVLTAKSYGIHAKNVYLNGGRLLADTSKGYLAKRNLRINGGLVIALTKEIEPLAVSAQASRYLEPEKSLEGKTLVFRDYLGNTLAAAEIESGIKGILLSSPDGKTVETAQAKRVSGDWMGSFCIEPDSYCDKGVIEIRETTEYDPVIRQYLN